MFTPRHLLAIEASIRSAVADIVDRATREQEFDFVDSISVPLPAIAIAELLGVPPSDRSKIFDWSNRMVGVDDPEFGRGQGSDREAATELFEYAQALAQDRLADPRDDIVTLLLTTEVDGEILDPIEFNLFFLLLAVAGNAPRSLITGGVLTLLEHPEEHARLKADPSLLPIAVEEMLRFVSPVNYFRRTVTRDTKVRGVALKAGDKVTLWYSSANRDGLQFPDPDRFDVARQPNAHVAFGGRGPHHCLGSHLARLQIRLMFEALLDGVIDRLELTGPVVRLRQNVVNGIKHMPVRLREVAAA